MSPARSSTARKALSALRRLSSSRITNGGIPRPSDHERASPSKDTIEGIRTAGFIIGVDDQTAWAQIAALYLALEQVEPSGPVRLARVVAVAHAFGPARAAAQLEELDRGHWLLQHLLTRHRAHAIRAHLRQAEGNPAAAREDFLAAADTTTKEPDVLEKQTCQSRRSTKARCQSFR